MTTSASVERMRQIALDTSIIAIRNIESVDYSGLVTLRMERGVIRRVWAGTDDGLLVWKDGHTICHIIRNVEE